MVYEIEIAIEKTTVCISLLPRIILEYYNHTVITYITIIIESRHHAGRSNGQFSNYSRNSRNHKLKDF